MFDLSKRGIPEYKRIWVMCDKKRKALHWSSWKQVFSKVDTNLKLQKQFFFQKGVFFQLWSWISPNAAFSKAAESELFETQIEKYFTGALQNTFVRNVDTYLKLP